MRPASYSSRPISVDLPSSTEPQVRTRSRSFWVVGAWSVGGRLIATRLLEITFAFLLFHRGGRVVVDYAARALGGARLEHFIDDCVERGRAAPPRPGAAASAYRRA